MSPSVSAGKGFTVKTTFRKECRQTRWLRGPTHVKVTQYFSRQKESKHDARTTRLRLRCWRENEQTSERAGPTYELSADDARPLVHVDHDGVHAVRDKVRVGVKRRRVAAAAAATDLASVAVAATLQYLRRRRRRRRCSLVRALPHLLPFAAAFAATELEVHDLDRLNRAELSGHCGGGGCRGEGGGGGGGGL